MPTLPILLAAPAPVPSSDWATVATRPGSGLGHLPTALSVQPLALMAELLLDGAAGLLAPCLGRRGAA
jgi:hypothetical protein